ncbi:MAG TPA: response regulator transcription factor [Caldithrix abyssi]|uniref:Response regulator transcription factor n=1 Tax=Caldithrix abyssi TaxID=187145 RepID=A0A7V4WUX4_CALAY|nr:response regulator transcription factor [Caldithrix abyssi]
MNALKAIIIDDVRLIRTELKILLQDISGIEVAGEAANGKEALDKISQLKPDILFLDIHLPDFSGFELLKKVKGDFKVIFISSFFNQYIQEAERYNPVEFLMKPINKEQLFKVVNQVINQSSK